MAHDNGDRDWEAIRLEVERADMTRNAICRKFLISRGELERRIRENRWNGSPRDDAGDQQKLIDALFWALERLVDHMGQMTLTTSDGSKEAAALGRLADTLDKLIGLQSRDAGKPGQRQSKDMTELRNRIGRRLDELGVR